QGSRRQPTDEEFLELENAVRELRSRYLKSSVNGSIAGDDDDGQRSKASGSGTDGSGKSRESSRRSSTKGETGEDGGVLPPSIARAWRTFDVAKQIEHEAKEKHKAEQLGLQKIRFREELEIHRRKQALKRSEEEIEKRKHMEDQERRLQEYRQEQEVLQQRHSDKHAEEKRLRDDQVKRQQAEKEAERQARLEKEMQDIELCKAQLQHE
ncbi:unnamed protein product, partial [Sphacelaria rigidula]